MTAAPVRVSPDWLALREPADADARAEDLVTLLRDRLPAGPVAVHDLGCGTGSMGRWLAPRLDRAQHWILYDRDADLLARAAADQPAGVTVETRERDITRLAPGDLAGASLVTASALLDMFTGEELTRFVATVAGAGCPALLTGSVVGVVELDPPDPLDARIAVAFNEHQRRTVAGRRLLGPDAVGIAAAEFARLGARVVVRPGPWRLGAESAALAAEWFAGWVDAAVEQQPDLKEEVAPYARRRRAEADGGRLAVAVHHDDLLVLP